MKSIIIDDEKNMLEFARQYVKNVPPGSVIFLYGQLGAGKTTFVRGAISFLGYDGNVKSPTYTFIEDYSLNDLNVYHFDLYRLSDPEELEWIGAREYFNSRSICFVEWPEKGIGFLPDNVYKIYIKYHPKGRLVKF